MLTKALSPVCILYVHVLFISTSLSTAVSCVCIYEEVYRIKQSDTGSGHKKKKEFPAVNLDEYLILYYFWQRCLCVGLQMCIGVSVTRRIIVVFHGTAPPVTLRSHNPHVDEAHDVSAAGG